MHLRFPISGGNDLWPAILAIYCLNPLSKSGQQYELLDWLANVTFPTEAKFSDLEFSGRIYESVVRRTIDSGVNLSLSEH